MFAKADLFADDSAGQPGSDPLGDRPAAAEKKTASTFSTMTAESRAAAMQRMQMQARKARGQLSRGPAAGGAMTSVASSGDFDDGFGARPSRSMSGRPMSSRGARPTSSGVRGAAATQMHRPTSGFLDDDIFGQGKKSTQSESKSLRNTEAELAAMGISAVYDPTEIADSSTAVRAAEGSGAAGGTRTGAVGGPGAKRPQKSRQAPVDLSDMPAFLTRIPKPGETVQCYIVRKKKMYSIYKLYLQQENAAGPAHANNTFLIAARKRKKNARGSNYLISLDEDVGNVKKSSPTYFGKVRANFVGSEFLMYDRGRSDANEEDDDGEVNPDIKEPRKELGVILYETNVLGTKGPRKMRVVVPPVRNDGTVAAAKEEGMLDLVKEDNYSQGFELANKAPRWNESIGAYCLNFNGRVTLPSVKNFQLQIEGSTDPDQVSLQFGKTGEHTFTMDYSYPLCALQAFQIVMSSFDHKWACE